MKKISSIVLCLAMIFSVLSLAGCSEKETTGKKVGKTEFVDFAESLVAEKVGTVDTDKFATCEGGLYYKTDAEKYGVISFNGLYDTGAKYTYCNNRKSYFEVSTQKVTSFDDIKALNSFGFIDGKGKTVVPAKYAKFEFLNERYVRVFEVTKRVYSEDEALVTYSANSFDLDNSDKVYFAGNWAVYDMVAGRLVKGVSGTAQVTVVANGKYITYYNEAKERFIVDNNGEPLPEGASVFSDGSYKVEEKEGTIYGADGGVLFTYDLTGFIPTGVDDDGNYYASKYQDGKSKYVLLDNTGKVISSEFDKFFTAYGELVICEEKIYNLDGKQVIDGTYDSLKREGFFNNCWILRDDDVYTMIKKDGSVFFQTEFDEDTTFFSSESVSGRKKGSDTYYYCHKDKDYTIKGYSFAPWLVKVPAENYLYNIVDTTSGEVLFEGYKEYTHAESANGSHYVYAKYDGGCDVFQILDASQVDIVKTKKKKLLSDLVEAFKAEGINVTVDQKSGEMAMDASVLFGGDSAKLTAEGKAFLDKFTKAYTEIVFSQEYKGFISKTLVEGHTAPVSGSSYADGLPLSKQRAAVVKAYCVSTKAGKSTAGFKASLEDIGYSNSQPVLDKNGKVDMSASRRVSFRFMIDVDAQ